MGTSLPAGRCGMPGSLVDAARFRPCSSLSSNSFFESESVLGILRLLSGQTLALGIDRKDVYVIFGRYRSDAEYDYVTISMWVPRAPSLHINLLHRQLVALLGALILLPAAWSQKAPTAPDKPW